MGMDEKLVSLVRNNFEEAEAGQKIFILCIPLKQGARVFIFLVFNDNDIECLIFMHAINSLNSHYSCREFS